MFDATTFIPSPNRHPIRSVRPFRTFRSVQWAIPETPLPTPMARGARGVGLRYECRVLDVMCAIYGGAFRRSPVIQYFDGRESVIHRAIPDGVLTLKDWTIIIEVKLAHTEVVWEQLMERYVPLLSHLTDAPLRPVEVCRSYDPAVPLPGPHALVDSLHRPPLASGVLEVLQWRI